MKKIRVNPFSAASIDEAIRQLEAYRDGLQQKANELCRRLAEIGLESAAAGFGSSLYDGTNDVTVQLDENENKISILAKGETVAFIEFGTGVRNPEHPLQGDIPGIVGHGQYGYGLGRLESWRYPMEKGAGTGGEADPKHKGYYITHGNPANMPMYNAAKEMRSQVLKIAQEVFNT